MQIFLDAVLSSVSIVACNSPMMWIQSPDVLHANCIVGVSEGWSMLLYSLCELRIEVVSICNRTE